MASTKVERDTAFDNEDSTAPAFGSPTKPIQAASGGLKEGVLLEVGFDDVTPN